MTTLDAIRDLCGSLPPFPDGCEVTGFDVDSGNVPVYWCGQLVRMERGRATVSIKATAPNGAKFAASIVGYIGESVWSEWCVWPLPTPCRQDALTCQRGASEPRGNVGG